MVTKYAANRRFHEIADIKSGKIKTVGAFRILCEMFCRGKLIAMMQAQFSLMTTRGLTRIAIPFKQLLSIQRTS